MCLVRGGTNGSLKNTIFGRNNSPPNTVISNARLGDMRKKKATDRGIQMPSARYATMPTGSSCGM